MNLNYFWNFQPHETLLTPWPWCCQWSYSSHDSEIYFYMTNNEVFGLWKCATHHSKNKNKRQRWSDSCPVVGCWLSKHIEALWHLICRSSCCLTGPGRLPVLMHCPITKIAVCRVREQRRGRGRPHTRPLTALNIAENVCCCSLDPKSHDRDWMSRLHSAERQTGQIWS